MVHSMVGCSANLRISHEAEMWRKVACHTTSAAKICISSFVLGASAIVVNGCATIAIAMSRSNVDCPPSLFGGSNGGGLGGRNGGDGSGGGSGGNESFNGRKALPPSNEEKSDDTAVTIVIPALNEEACIAETVNRLVNLDPPPHRVIVVDGGSHDSTVQLAERSGALVTVSGKGRAVQLNRGADMAIKDPDSCQGILCFVHADTCVPRDIVSILRKELGGDRGTICVGFVPIIALPERVLWGMTLHNTVKTWYGPLLLRPVSAARGLRCLFGDQTISCRVADFVSVGGFDESLPIMEDCNLCERLHKMLTGKVRMVNRGVVTSGRRMAKVGPWRATMVQIIIGFSYAFGASPGRLCDLYKAFYKDVR